MKEQWVELYCPKCGESSIIEGEYPGIVPTTDWMLDCPECGTTWRVVIGFYEVEKETYDASGDAQSVGEGDSLPDSGAEA